jgi:hypothetical protein
MIKIIVYTTVLAVYICVYALYGCCADAASDTFKYDPKGKRDPFIPLVGQEKSMGAGLETVVSPDDLKLEGIATVAGGKQVAIINGQMVRENDKFGVLLIKKISRKSVELSIEGMSHTLTLQETEKGDENNKQ